MTKKVLIAEDYADTRTMMRYLLQHFGYDVLEAADGQEAVDKTKENEPDLILMDISMPVMDGFATCRNLHKDPETSQIPVVLVTSKTTDSDVFWGRKQGASDHVGKPWDKQLIEDMLKRYCQK